MNISRKSAILAFQIFAATVAFSYGQELLGDCEWTAKATGASTGHAYADESSANNGGCNFGIGWQIGGDHWVLSCGFQIQPNFIGATCYNNPGANFEFINTTTTIYGSIRLNQYYAYTAGPGNEAFPNHPMRLPPWVNPNPGGAVLAPGTYIVSGSVTNGDALNFALHLYPEPAEIVSTVIVTASPNEGGTVTGGGLYLVTQGVPISATPATGWQFTGWSDGNTDNPRNISVPPGTTTYTAKFSPRPQAIITVIANPPAGGTVTPGDTYFAGDVVVIAAHPTADLSATPPTNWVFVGWNDGNVDNPRTVTVPVAGATYTANFSRTAVITFYHEPAIGFTGHVFLSLTTKEGVMAFYGYYPAGSIMVGPGYIDDERYTPWDSAIAYPITDANYRSVARTITQDLVSPPTFFLGGFNCMWWAAKIASVAGSGLPDFRNLAAIPDPAYFGLSLAAIPEGETFEGGTVIRNHSPTKLAMTGTVAMPYDYSYSQIESAGHTNPATLATAIGLAYDFVDVGTVNANSINGLTLTLTGTTISSAVISMNWGDGHAFEEQSLVFSHVYSAGTYSAHLLIVDTGAVHSYNMTVVVSSSIAASVTLNVTPFPPVTTSNQGLTPAYPVPDFVVVQPTSMSVLTNGHAVINFFGVPTWTFTIEATSNLTQGFLPIGNGTAGADGAFQYDDPTAVNVPRRFYRATYP